MLTDRFQNPTSGACPDSIAALDHYAGEFLSYGANLGQLLADAETHPNCLSLQAHAAAVHMALEAAAGFEAARPFLARAQALSEGGTPREQAFVKACEAWAVRDINRAAQLLTDIAETWPSDVVAAKWAQYHAFNKGNAELMKRAAEAVLQGADDRPYLWGLMAFAKEQLHDIRGAEEDARRAMAIEPNDAWAHHAMAHVMETEGRIDEGIEFLTERIPSWSDRSVFIREHNHWHLGLFYLDKDNPQAVLDLYDKALWGEWPEFGQEQIGAIAMLWRLELRGVDVGERWGPVAAKVAERELEHVLPFHDLHYVYALARGGENARLNEMLASMATHARADHAEALIWGDIALPTAKALAALGQKQYAAGAEALGPMLDHLQQIGGSHAQRDLFHQAHIDALLRGGSEQAALPMLRARAEGRPAATALKKLLDWAEKAAYA